MDYNVKPIWLHDELSPCRMRAGSSVILSSFPCSFIMTSLDPNVPSSNYSYLQLSCVSLLYFQPVIPSNIIHIASSWDPRLFLSLPASALFLCFGAFFLIRTCCKPRPLSKTQLPRCRLTELSTFLCTNSSRRGAGSTGGTVDRYYWAAINHGLVQPGDCQADLETQSLRVKEAPSHGGLS